MDTTTDAFGGIIQFQDWTTIGVDLSAHLGDSVQIEFSTGDCSQGGHFGYAYIDAECGPLEIETEYDGQAGSVVLSAPEGFDYLWNTGDTTRSVTITDPIPGEGFECTLISINGCMTTLQVTLEFTVEISDLNTKAPLTIHPDPSEGRSILTGAIPGDRIEVFDAIGKRISSGKVGQSGSHIIELTGPAGIFFVRLSGTGGEINVLRLIKM